MTKPVTTIRFDEIGNVEVHTTGEARVEVLGKNLYSTGRHRALMLVGRERLVRVYCNGVFIAEVRAGLILDEAAAFEARYPESLMRGLSLRED